MCSVGGCDSWRRSAQCFNLPGDPEMRSLWVQFLAKDDEQHFKKSLWSGIAVCREHFLAECFEKAVDTDKVQLKPSAVPSVRIKTEVSEFVDSLQLALGNPLETEDDFFSGKERVRGAVTSNEDLFPIKKPVLAKEEHFEQEIKGRLPNQEYGVGKTNDIFPIVTKEEDTENDIEEDTKVPVYMEMPTEVRRSAWQTCNECGYFCHPDRAHICEYKLKPFACNTCGKRFFTMLSLNMHCHIHSNSKIHTCKYCYAPFQTKQEKLNHQLSHKGTLDPFQCHTCPARFTSFLDRREHEETHLEPREHRCEECGITFNRRHYLVRHMFVHTGEKPFKCLICDRGFNQPGHLKSHMRLHTGETPYQCPHCDKSFNHNVSLKSHIQRYHPNKRSNNTDDAHDSNDTESDSGDDHGEKEQDADEAKEQETAILPKIKRWATGRPKGRPKRNFDEESSSKRKKKIRKSQPKKQQSDEESEELTDNNCSFDLDEEEEQQEAEQASRRHSSRLKNYTDPDYKPERKRTKRLSRRKIRVKAKI